MSGQSRKERLLPLAVIGISLLPHLSIFLPGQSYYFRDFAFAFYPLRAFAAREMAAGRWPWWNPYVHEGTFMLPDFYPVDLLHVLWSSPAAVSWLLTLQFPLAALAAYGLARELGANRWGALVSGTFYAMGGFALSSLNLYLYFQALALAPAVALCLLRAATRGGRWRLAAAAAVAFSLATLAVEFVVQAVLLGLALGLAVARGRRALARMGTGLLFGAGWAAVPVAVMLALSGETHRAMGFDPSAVLAHAANPVALIEVLVPGLFGSPAAPLREWWGEAIFSGGYPYFITLYMGPLALALACAGLAAIRGPLRVALLSLGVLGIWYALGEWGGLAPLMTRFAFLRVVRYPSKALLLPYLVTCVLAGLGTDALARGDGWRRLRLAAVALAVVALGLGGLVAWNGVAGNAKLLRLSPGMAALMTQAVPVRCLRSVGLALAALAVALGVRRRWLPAPHAAVLLAGFALGDLGVAASAANPHVSSAVFRLLPELASARLTDLDGGRVFSYGILRSPTFLAYAAQREPGSDLWAFFVSRQLLDPLVNVADGIEVAEGRDRTSFLAQPTTIDPEEYDPRFVARLLTRLRSAAVTRVLSLDSLNAPGLRLERSIPSGLPGLQIHSYELEGSWPRAYFACRTTLASIPDQAYARSLADGFDPRHDVVLEVSGYASCHGGSVRLQRFLPGETSYTVVVDGPGYLVVRDAYARGWEATVDGLPAPVLRANGRHRAVPVGGGSHALVLRYRPPGLAPGLAAMVASILAGVWLWFRPLPREERSLGFH